MTEDQRAEPIWKGAEYCSPWCGCGCTRAAWERAQAEAYDLSKRCGEGWVPHVWENAGWHYEVAQGVCEIKPSLRHRMRSGPRHEWDNKWEVEGYQCWIQTRPQFISGTHPTPHEAFREALGKMRAVFDQLADSMSFVWQLEESIDRRLLEAGPAAQKTEPD